MPSLRISEGNESVQETADALLALYEQDSAGYRTETIDAGVYMKVVQLGTGGWESYAGAGENSEITGEALWGIAAIPEPTTALLLGLGLTALGLRRRSRL